MRIYDRWILKLLAVFVVAACEKYFTTTGKFGQSAVLADHRFGTILSGSALEEFKEKTT